MKTFIVLVMLIGTVASAATNIVLYSADNGVITAVYSNYRLEKWKISGDGQTVKDGPEVWMKKKILFTTENPVYGMNVSQLTNKTLVDPYDMLNDYTQWTGRERKMLSLIVKEINILRARAGLEERTKAQVIQALRNE